MTALGIILGFIPSFVWLLFYLSEDPKPEPKRRLAYAFILGGISSMFALFLQLVLKNYGALDQIASKTNLIASVIPLLLLAVTEEVAKFGAAYFAVYKNRDFDEPIDAMIYMIVAALGFATVENIAVLTNQFSDQSLVAAFLGITTSRMLGATLLHALAAAFTGYYWALSLKTGKRWLLPIGIVIATVLHAGFNFLILNQEGLIYPLVLLIVGGFFVLEDFESLKIT